MDKFLYGPMSNAGSLEELQKVLPENVRNWAKAEQDQFYDGQTIFDYIDGAGEVYRAYNMQRCLSRRYVAPRPRRSSLISLKWPLPMMLSSLHP